MYETKEERDAFYKSKEWRKLRLNILERDNHECQRCKANGYVTSTNETLVVDHIKELADYPELRLEPDNLQVLCFKCHEIKHGRFFTPKPNKWRGDEWW